MESYKLELSVFYLDYRLFLLLDWVVAKRAIDGY
jgi:hypothetical protein